MNSINSLEGLAEAGLITPSSALEAVTARYAVAITPAISNLIRQGAPASPPNSCPMRASLKRRPRKAPTPSAIIRIRL